MYVARITRPASNTIYRYSVTELPRWRNSEAVSSGFSPLLTNAYHVCQEKWGSGSCTVDSHTNASTLELKRKRDNLPLS